MNINKSARSQSSSFFQILPCQAANGDELAAAEGQAFLTWRHGWEFEMDFIGFFNGCEFLYAASQQLYYVLGMKTIDITGAAWQRWRRRMG